MNKAFPYATGLLVGFFTVPVFAAGFQLSFAVSEIPGRLLMAVALLMWPVMAAVVLYLSLIRLKDNPYRRRLWYRSLFFPPFGAVVGLFALRALEALIL